MSSQESVSADIKPVPLPWAGRIFLFVGVVLLGLSLRHAVTGVSPLLSTIQTEIGMGTLGATLLGMLPTIAFGIAGFATPMIIRRLGLPLVAVIALGLGAFGTVVRVLADGPFVFLVFGAIALFGMGMGNVVGPPLVKKYLPDRQGTAMSVLVLMMQAGATIPAMLALPLANAAGWRIAVGSWALLMILAALPWLSALVKNRSDNSGTSCTASGAGAPISCRSPRFGSNRCRQPRSRHRTVRSHSTAAGTARQWFSLSGVTETNRSQRIATARRAFDDVLRSAIAQRGLLTRLERVALVAYSGRLASPQPFTPAGSPRVLAVHGAADPVIPAANSTETVTALRELGLDASSRILPGVGAHHFGRRRSTGRRLRGHGAYRRTRLIGSMRLGLKLIDDTSYSSMRRLLQLRFSSAYENVEGISDLGVARAMNRSDST